MRTLALVVALSAASQAQSFDWSSDFAVHGLAATAVPASVMALEVFDDGSGAAVFAAGQISTAGHEVTGSVAKWNGSAWSAVPSQLGQFLGGVFIYALEVYDDGSGAALYAGGTFASIGGVGANNLARWNGATWQALGTSLGSSSVVRAMRVLDFGAGPVLCVGGNLIINGSTATSIAQWDGTSWSLIGTQVEGNVYDFAVYDDGSGSKLYCGGQLMEFPNTAGWSSVARFDGTTWENVGGATAGGVASLAVFDDGSGSALFAGGSFGTINGNPVGSLAKWNGTSWSSVGGGVAGVQAGNVEELSVHDDGSGPALLVAGTFDSAGGVPARNIARWDGSSFTALGDPDGIEHEGASLNPATARALAEFDAGNGLELVVGGHFTRAGALVASSAARWDGSQWSTLGDPGVELGATARVSVLASFDAGSGPRLLAAGEFDAVGATPSVGLASFDGASWSSFGLGAERGVYAASSHDDGGGEALYIGGSFDTVDGQPAPRLAKWDGTQWSGLVATMTPSSAAVYDIATYDDGLGGGPQLYAGGSFKTVDGIPAQRIARWDGAAWHMVGSIGASNTVGALVVHDDGTGSKLYAAGGFIHMDGQTVFGIARWNGVVWEPVGGGFNSSVSHLAVFDAGSGPELYAAGQFGVAMPSTPVDGIARWNGSAWTVVGNGIGVNGSIHAFEVFDDGSGSALYAGGGFSSIDGVAMAGLARWNGSAWSAAATFVGQVQVLEVFDDGSGLGDALFVGGSISSVEGRPSAAIAKLGRSCTPTTYCSSGTTSNGCAPSISGSGTPSASASSGFTIAIANVEGQKQGHVFYGVSGAIAAPWGASSHFLCVKAPTQRTGTQDSGGSAGACNGSIALDWNAYCATHPGALGVPFSAGQSVWAQLYFRDPPGPKTTALSNGLTFTVCP